MDFIIHSSALGWKIKYLTFSVWWLDVEKEKVEKELKVQRHSSFFSDRFSQLKWGGANNLHQIFFGISLCYKAMINSQPKIIEML